jgi:DNA-binding SARP family transcriptional activator
MTSGGDGAGRLDLAAGDASRADRVELHLAGVFSVIRDGVRLTDGSLRSRKARTLRKLLAVERARLVSVDRIAEVLWADGPPAKPAQHVATLVSRLRRVLGPGVIRGGRPGYQLDGARRPWWTWMRRPG